MCDSGCWCNREGNRLTKWVADLPCGPDESVSQPGIDEVSRNNRLSPPCLSALEWSHQELSVIANRLPASYSWTPHCSICRQLVQSVPDEHPESWCLFWYFAVGGFMDVVMSSVDQTRFIDLFEHRVVVKSLSFGYLEGCRRRSFRVISILTLSSIHVNAGSLLGISVYKLF